MNVPFRIEQGLSREMKVPENAYYGAQTARAVENFPISGLRFPRGFIRALGLIKSTPPSPTKACNCFPGRIAGAIQKSRAGGGRRPAGRPIRGGHFPTGSGTSTNMNANEVIASRAAELLGGKRGDKSVTPTTM